MNCVTRFFFSGSGVSIDSGEPQNPLVSSLLAVELHSKYVTCVLQVFANVYVPDNTIERKKKKLNLCGDSGDLSFKQRSML